MALSSAADTVGWTQAHVAKGATASTKPGTPGVARMASPHQLLAFEGCPHLQRQTGVILFWNNTSLPQ